MTFALVGSNLPGWFQLFGRGQPTKMSRWLNGRHGRGQTHRPAVAPPTAG